VAHFEAVSLRLRIEHGNRFLAVGRVVIDVHDLLALQLVHPAFLHADEFDLGGVLAPVIGDEGKHPREHAPVGGVGAAVADRHDRDVVRRALVDERIGDARGKRVHERRSGRAALLGALVALDAARVVVFGLAFLVSELDPVDAAIARVDHVHVVDEPAEDSRTPGRVGTDPVAVHRDELFVLRIGGASNSECRGRQERGASDFAQHWNPPLDGNLPVSTGYRNEQPRLL
jgi:hypothetical protein